MTIAAAYLVSEGVVLGADSSTTVQVSSPQGVGVVQLLRHSQKVFEVGENSRFGVCTWGAGTLGKTSHRTVMARLAGKIKDEISVRSAAEELTKIAEPLVRESGISYVGYYLGGWNSESHDPDCYKVEINQGVADIAPLESGQSSFSGQPFFFSRVFHGYDIRLASDLKAEIKRSLPQSAAGNFDSLFDGILREVAQRYVSAGFKDLPIREAIDYLYSYLHITVKAEKFKFGAPTCGGPIEVAFISSDRCFRWVRHKPFHSAIIEEEGEYDVGQ